MPCGTPLAGTAYQAFTTTPTFGACCTSADAETQIIPGAGVAVTAGTQYWVVADANPAGDTNTADAWADAGTQTQALQLGGSTSAWGSFPGTGASAVKVTGTKP